MAKQLQLNIPEPCHEGWEKMTPSEKGRFCDSCQKQVIDFSVMSDRQMAEFFKKPILSLSKGRSVCGHFTTDQLDRAIDIPKKRIPWVKYFFQITLPAFLLSMKASAQRSPRRSTTTKNSTLPEKGSVSNTTCNTLMGDTVIMPVKPAPPSDRMVDGMVSYAYLRPLQPNGKVVNERGEPLPGATVMIKGTKTGVAASAEGTFNLKPKEYMEELVLQASYIGYETLEVKVDEDSPSSLTLVLKEKENNFTGGLVIISKPKIKKEIKNVPLMSSPISDNKPGFRVFPNPAAAGGKLSIESKKLKAGEYSLGLLDQSGQSVHQQDIRIEEKIKLQIDLPQVAAGSYFLVLTDKKTGKKFTEKIVIQ